MPIKILVADLLKSDAQTFVNTVNCVGIMGKGIALEFKKRFPAMYDEYVARCERHEVRLGVPYVYHSLFPPQVINFPTKDHWKSVSKVDDIERGLKYLVAHYREWGITSLAMPPLGCGNGQLEWESVGPLIYHYLLQLDIPIELYAPYGTPPRELTVEFLSQDYSSIPASRERSLQTAVNPAWVALIDIVDRIEAQPYHWPIGRTLFQKISYVATREGLPTGFQYERASFGPFTKDLKRAESKLVNSNLMQEEQQGNLFLVKVGPQFHEKRKDFQAALAQWEGIILKTTDLFMRVNIDLAEIITTVLFSADVLAREQSSKPSETDVMEAVMKWKQKRKPPINQTEVSSAIRNLGILHWLDVTPVKTLAVYEDDVEYG